MENKIIEFSELQKQMRIYLEEEDNTSYIEIEADTLEDALKDASLELSVPYNDLDYEVLIKGSKGFVGYGKKRWKIVAYRGSRSGIKADNATKTENKKEEIISSNGEFFIRRTSKEVLLKVIPPKGFGENVKLEAVLEKLNNSNIEKYSKDMVKEIVNSAKGHYEQIAEFKADPSENVTMIVQISQNLMAASIEFNKPGINGAEVMSEDIYNILKKYGIIDKAVLKDEVEKFIDTPVYTEAIELARGVNPIRGKDSYIDFISDNTYSSEYDDSKANLRNVVEDEVLAEIIPATKGTNGYDVFGKVIDAAAGQNIDVLLLLGENVGRGGNKIYAKSNGYMSVVNGLISVYSVFVVEGDVGPGTGDIINNGMVLVKGGILDGYNVIAKSGIEVTGVVGRGNLKTDGNIILNGGANGKGESKISAKGSVVSKFLENVTLRAGGDIKVSRGIVNSFVSSKTNVFCVGKKSKIVGSYVYAKDEVRAYSIGSDANNNVIIEVGYDPEIKNLLDKFTKYLEKIEEKAGIVNKGILSLKNNIPFITDKAEKAIKIDNFNELVNEDRVLKLEIKMVNREQQDLQIELERSKSEGKVSVEHTAFSGVKLHIKNAYYELKKDYNNVTFVEDDNYIKTVSYSAFKSEKSKTE